MSSWALGKANQPIFLHQACFIKFCLLGYWLSSFLVRADMWISGSDVQFMAVGPEEDINLAEGQFIYLEELWISKWITLPLLLWKIKMNPRQVVNCPSFDLICLTNVQRSSHWQICTEARKYIELSTIVQSKSFFKKLDKHFPAVLAQNGKRCTTVTSRSFHIKVRVPVVAQGDDISYSFHKLKA